jgi:hypothetical protein
MIKLNGFSIVVLSATNVVAVSDNITLHFHTLDAAIKHLVGE